MNRKALPIIGVMLAALAAIGLAALIAWNQLAGRGPDAAAPRNGEAVVAPGISVGGSFDLTDARGESVSETAFQGRYMLVYFGYASCPDVCPTELSSMAAALDITAETDPTLAERVVPIFITIDPERDTPEVMKDYAAAFHPRMVGLTGSPEAISDIARKYRVFYSRRPTVDQDFYLINHSGYFYFMGPEGDFITMFHGGTSPDSMAEAIRRYVAGGKTS